MEGFGIVFGGRYYSGTEMLVIGIAFILLCIVLIVISEIITGKHKDPARETYFYWRGDWWMNLKAVCSDTVKGNLSYADKFFGLASYIWKKNVFGKLGAIFLFFSGLTVTLTSFAFLPLFLVPFVCVFFVIFMIYNVLALIVNMGAWLILKLHGVFALCPHCSHRVTMPVYKCNGCLAEHKRLLPTARYGLLYRTCDCGGTVPTMWISGKHKLKAICPKCREGIHSKSAIPMTIAFIGGRSSGKTFLMMDFLCLLQQKVLPRRKWKFSVDALDDDRMKKIHERFSMGKAVQATTMDDVVGLCLEVKKPGWAFPKRLYFYDPPGESFTEVDKLRPGFDYYEYLRYVIFVIDPFSYDEVRRQFQVRGVNLGSAMVSTMTANDTFTALLNAMEEKYGKMPKKATVCAVVINKADVDYFKDVTGLVLGDIGKPCRAFLEQHDGNLVGLLEENFTKCEYFAISAQGRKRGPSGEYVPEGVENVIEFFLNEMG